MIFVEDRQLLLAIGPYFVADGLYECFTTHSQRCSRVKSTETDMVDSFRATCAWQMADVGRRMASMRGVMGFMAAQSVSLKMWELSRNA